MSDSSRYVSFSLFLSRLRSTRCARTALNRFTMNPKMNGKQIEILRACFRALHCRDVFSTWNRWCNLSSSPMNKTGSNIGPILYLALLSSSSPSSSHPFPYPSLSTYASEMRRNTRDAIGQHRARLFLVDIPSAHVRREEAEREGRERCNETPISLLANFPYICVNRYFRNKTTSLILFSLSLLYPSASSFLRACVCVLRTLRGKRLGRREKE